MKTELNIAQLIKNFSQEQDSIEKEKKWHVIMKRFFLWLENNGHNWKELGISHIIKYKRYLYANYDTKVEIRLHIVVIKIFSEWIEQNEIYPNVARGIKIPKVPGRITEDEIQALEYQDKIIDRAINYRANY